MSLMLRQYFISAVTMMVVKTVQTKLRPSKTLHAAEKKQHFAFFLLMFLKETDLRQLP